MPFEADDMQRYFFSVFLIFLTVSMAVAAPPKGSQNPSGEARYRDQIQRLLKYENQLENIADLNAQSDVKAKLSKQLMSILEKSDDPRLTDAFDRPPYVVRH